MSNLGERLAQEIERLGGVSAVANALKVARNTIYNWVEKENIPANKLLELGELGADASFILSGISSTKVFVRDKEEASQEAGQGRVRFVLVENPDDPLSQRKIAIKQLVDQLDDQGLGSVEDELKKLERIRHLEEEVAELRRKTG